jgi:hypothetical protein
MKADRHTGKTKVQSGRQTHRLDNHNFKQIYRQAYMHTGRNVGTYMQTYLQTYKSADIQTEL